MTNAPNRSGMPGMRESVPKVVGMPLLQGPNDTEKRTLDELREILDQIEPKAAYLFYYITVTSNDNPGIRVTVPSVSEAKDQSIQPSGS